MKKFFTDLRVLLLCGLAVIVNASNVQAQDDDKQVQFRTPSALLQRVDLKRVAQLAPDLIGDPKGLSEKYQNRSYWEGFKQTNRFNNIIKTADNIVANGFPQWNDDDYLSFFTKGNTEVGKALLIKRLIGLESLVWAECLQNDGRYVKDINNAFLELVNQKSWVSPGDDYGKTNYTQKVFTVDLSSADYAYNMASALYILDDKVQPDVKKKVLAALDTRIFNPVLTSVQNGDNYNSWLTKTSNWNPVCLSGVVGAALTVLTDKSKRASFLTIAERYSGNYMAGFSDDGYCSEGIDYYNYGMSRFICLRESIWLATKGQVDLFAAPKMQKIIQFLPKMEMANGVYPSIADAKPGLKPNPFVIAYFENLYEPNPPLKSAKEDPQSPNLIQNFVEFGHSPVITTIKKLSMSSTDSDNDLRSYFNVAGVLVERKQVNGNPVFGAAIKGGNNNENHNHNDLGSFSIASSELMMGDPGTGPYNAVSFSSRRYTIKTNASYGHPVPLIAGQQQVPGEAARAKITQTNFTPSQDQLTMDITSAYSNVKDLTSIIRTFIFNRDNSSLTVTDKFAFSSPESFETAVITRQDWKQVGTDKILITGKKDKLLLTISTDAGPFSIRSEVINDGGLPYTRIGIYLAKPSASGSLKVVYSAN